MSWRRLVLHNFWLKFLSVLLASLIWFAVDANIRKEPIRLHTLFRPESSRDFPDRPILVLESPGHMSHWRVEPAKATVTVVGPARTLEQIHESDVAVFVRVAGSPKTIMPAVVEVHAPLGVSVSDISPAAVLVKPADPP
jgi:YbbR domain-containing protein